MTTRRVLVVFLGLAAAVLSFDALYARALTSGLIPEHAFIWPWILAALWAFVIDGAGAAGILGIKDNAKDKKAWAMFLLAALASLAFQATTPPITWSSVLAKAVAPIALGFAIVVLELSKPAPDARPGVGERTLERPTTPPASAPRDSARAAAPRPRSAGTAVKAERGHPQTSPRVPLGEAAPGGSTPAREVVRNLVAAERSGGPRATAAIVMAETGVGQSRAFELLKQERSEVPAPERNGHAEVGS